MRILKLLTLAIVILFPFITSQARKTEVWDHPAIEFGSHNGDGYFNIALDVTQVELKETETIVHMTVRQRPDSNGSHFDSGTYLNVDGKRYTALSVDGIAFNEAIQTDRDGRLDVVFHFPPLPQGTKYFDFMEGDGPNAFQIKGISPVEGRWKQLFPSYWRDDKTGDWEIAFFEDCAIYRCKFWNYKQCDVDSKAGTAEMVICSGDEELKVSVGKNRNGQRTIRIGSQKVTCSMLTSRFMPGYPVKDTRTGFVDNGYKADTVTVVGWLKDMPEYYRQEKTFQICSNNFFTGEQDVVYAELDEQGRFMAKVPVINSTEFFCDWSRCFIRTMFEPGKTYFMLYDFKEGRRYFMGDDVRLQNELFKYPLDWNVIRMEGGNDFDAFIASADSLIKAQDACIDRLCASDPSLSTRFNVYRKGNTLCQQAFSFGQARFRGQDFRLPENASQYAHDTFWTRLPEPITLHRDIRTFLEDYISDIKRGHSPATVVFDVRGHLAECASNDEELELLTRWSAIGEETEARINALSTQEEKQRLAEQVNAENAELFHKVEQILNNTKVCRMIHDNMLMEEMKKHTRLIDSLQAPSIVKDITLCNLVYKHIENECYPLSPEAKDMFLSLVNNPVGLETIEQLDNSYQALVSREFDRLVLKSSDNLQGLTEGEALLRKILEPFKGKIVLLDVWGTWCGPCKEALQHTAEEYARLSKYDVAYVYLANNSPMDSWENVIKMYNVSGENVAHYNLPAEQQAAIERYLGVRSFPTYKLFDRNGNLLDLKVDVRNLDRLEFVIQGLSR